jgi:hypothetical protein
MNKRTIVSGKAAAEPEDLPAPVAFAKADETPTQIDADAVDLPDGVGPKASVCRMVCYTSAGEKSERGEIHAAVITGVDSDEVVSLRVFTRTQDFVLPRVSLWAGAAEEQGAQGRWSWPKRRYK